MWWLPDARCVGEDPELFFPVGTSEPALSQVEGGIVMRLTAGRRFVSSNHHDTARPGDANRISGHPRKIDDDLDSVSGFEDVERRHTLGERAAAAFIQPFEQPPEVFPEFALFEKDP